MKATMTIINNETIELVSDKCPEFLIAAKSANLYGKWNKKKSFWTFEAKKLGKLTELVIKYFDTVETKAVQRKVLDKKADTRRKIIIGACLLKYVETNVESTEPFDVELRELMNEFVGDLESDRDRELFNYEEQRNTESRKPSVKERKRKALSNSGVTKADGLLAKWTERIKDDEQKQWRESA